MTRGGAPSHRIALGKHTVPHKTGRIRWTFGDLPTVSLISVGPSQELCLVVVRELRQTGDAGFRREDPPVQAIGQVDVRPRVQLRSPSPLLTQPKTFSSILGEDAPDWQPRRGRRRGGVDDPRPRRPQSPDAGHVRLDLPDPFRSDFLEAVDAIGGAPLLERRQARELILVEGNDQFSAMAVGNAVVVGEALELELPFSTKPRLEGSRGVVESRVQHARVVAGLMDAEVGFLLNDCHAQGRL